MVTAITIGLLGSIPNSPVWGCYTILTLYCPVVKLASHSILAAKFEVRTLTGQPKDSFSKLLYIKLLF